MLNIAENPILLITIAVFTFCSLVIFSNIAKSWKILIPLAIALLGVGIDHFVETDYEKIDSLIISTKDAFVAQDIEIITRNISTDYKDSLHKNKAELVSKFKSVLRKPVATKIKFMYKNIEASNNSALVTIKPVVHIDPQSRYGGFGSPVIVKLSFSLVKEMDDWKLISSELLEINNQPVNWRVAK